MDIVNFDALKAQGKIIDAKDVDPNEDYFILGKKNVHYTTNSMKATNYPIWAIKAGDILNPLPTYKVYTALLNQVGTSNPVATVLENTIGNIVWTRSSAGEYYGTLAGAFGDGSKAFIPNVLLYGGAVTDRLWVANYDSPDTVSVQHFDASVYADGLYNTPIEIRIYN